MNRFVYVEDIIEYIAGYRDLNNIQFDMWQKQSPPLSLARYDVSIIESFAWQTFQSIAYTQKQSELAVKLIHKYKKQLAAQSIPIGVPDEMNFRLGVRHVDQSKRIWLEKDRLYVKFPFDKTLIDLFKNTAREEAVGRAYFDYETKTWILSVTEFMINFVATLAKTHQFELDPQIEILYQKILQVEQSLYKIQLQIVNNKLEITNAAKDLLLYIDEFCHGLSINNLIKLVDMSSVLGYSVSLDLLKTVRRCCTRKEFWLLANKRFNIIDSKKIKSRFEITMEDILAYAKLTDRLPIHVYNPGANKQDTDEIIYLNKKSNFVNPDNIKLLVSSTPILIGTRKQNLFNIAEKVIILT